MIDGRIHFAGNPGPEDRADDTGPFDAEWTGATALPHVDGYTRDHRFETVIRPAPFPELPHAAWRRDLTKRHHSPSCRATR